MNPIISTDRLNIRNWLESDIAALVQMNKDQDVMRYFLSTMSDRESFDFFNRISAHFNKTGFGLYVVESRESNEFLGYTGFMIADFESSFTPCIEIGWRFNKRFWGKGFATEAAKACLDYGFSILNFEKVYSFTSIYNKKSEAVMKRIGMSKIGEFSHPKVPVNNELRLHVNYIIEKEGHLTS